MRSLESRLTSVARSSICPKGRLFLYSVVKGDIPRFERRGSVPKIYEVGRDRAVSPLCTKAYFHRTCRKKSGFQEEWNFETAKER